MAKNAHTAEITGGHFKLMADFLPRLGGSRHETRLRLGGRTWDELRTALARAFPVFAGIQVAESWAGLIDVTPDAVPVIDQVAHMPELSVGTGFSGHGFGIGPGAGRLMADLVAGDPPLVDRPPFRLARFPGPRR